MVDTPTVAARRARLKEWIDAHHRGVQADFRSKIGINQGELSALLNGGKSFGEKKAEAIEVAAGMPSGHLVRPLSDNTSTKSQPTRLDLDKLRSAIEVAMAMKGPLLAENVVAAYELLTREVVTDLPPRGHVSTRGGAGGAIEGRDSGVGADTRRARHQGSKER